MGGWARGKEDAGAAERKAKSMRKRGNMARL
jgi:hypothetical protein